MPDWLPVSAVVTRSRCLVISSCAARALSTASAKSDAGRDKNAGGHHVVLGLADEIGGNVDRVSGVVGEDRDLGGTGFRVDADQSAAQTLGGSDIDVAGTGDEVDRDKARFHRCRFRRR